MKDFLFDFAIHVPIKNRFIKIINESTQQKARF